MEWNFDTKTEIFIHLTSSCWLWHFINIYNVELLVEVIVSSVESNVVVLSISMSSNIHNLSVLLIYKITIFVDEQLPPSWGSSFRTKIEWSTIALDRQWSILPLLRLDGLWLLIIEELLVSATFDVISKSDIVTSIAFNDSLHWHSWLEVEWSIDIKTNSWVSALCSWFLGPILIDDSPELSLWTILSPDSNTVTFCISSSWNINNLVVLDIDKSVVFVSKDLPPSWVGVPSLEIIWSSRTCDVPWPSFVLPVLDSFGLLVEPPELSLSVSSRSLDDHSSSDEIEMSLSW